MSSTPEPSRAMLKPTAEQLAGLTRFERFTFSMMDFVNRRGWLKQILGQIGYSTYSLILRNLTERSFHVVGLEQVEKVDRSHGILIAANHQSFFDLFLCSHFIRENTSLVKRAYYPVRSDFFYDRLLGFLGVNAGLTAFSMYPPIFRESSKRDFNNFAVKRMAEILDQPGNLLGIHPEGKRNKSGDPYALLPAQPGIGKILLTARPVVIPVFLNGMTNNMGKLMKRNFSKDWKPVIMVFGQPMDLSEFYEKNNTLRVQMQAAEAVMKRIRELGEVEKKVRADVVANSRRGPQYYELKDWETTNE